MFPFVNHTQRGWQTLGSIIMGVILLLNIEKQYIYSVYATSQFIYSGPTQSEGVKNISVLLMTLLGLYKQEILMIGTRRSTEETGAEKKRKAYKVSRFLHFNIFNSLINIT